MRLVLSLLVLRLRNMMEVITSVKEWGSPASGGLPRRTTFTFVLQPELSRNTRQDILFIIFLLISSLLWEIEIRMERISVYRGRVVLGAQCVFFCTSSVKQHSPDTKRLWFPLQLGVIAVRVEDDRVLKSVPPCSLYLPLTRLSWDWIITHLPPGNCRSRNPLMFWWGEKRRKRKREPDNNSARVGAVVALVISFFHKAPRGAAVGRNRATGCGVTPWCVSVLLVCVSDTKMSSQKRETRLICVHRVWDSCKYWAPEAVASRLIHACRWKPSPPCYENTNTGWFKQSVVIGNSRGWLGGFHRLLHVPPRLHIMTTTQTGGLVLIQTHTLTVLRSVCQSKTWDTERDGKVALYRQCVNKNSIFNCSKIHIFVGACSGIYLKVLGKLIFVYKT